MGAACALFLLTARQLREERKRERERKREEGSIFEFFSFFKNFRRFLNLFLFFFPPSSSSFQVQKAHRGTTSAPSVALLDSVRSSLRSHGLRRRVVLFFLFFFFFFFFVVVVGSSASCSFIGGKRSEGSHPGALQARGRRQRRRRGASRRCFRFRFYCRTSRFSCFSC